MMRPVLHAEDFTPTINEYEHRTNDILRVSMNATIDAINMGILPRCTETITLQVRAAAIKEFMAQIISSTNQISHLRFPGGSTPYYGSYTRRGCDDMVTEATRRLETLYWAASRIKNITSPKTGAWMKASAIKKCCEFIEAELHDIRGEIV